MLEGKKKDLLIPFTILSVLRRIEEINFFKDGDPISFINGVLMQKGQEKGRPDSLILITINPHFKISKFGKHSSRYIYRDKSKWTKNKINARENIVQFRIVGKEKSIKGLLLCNG